MTFLLRGPNGEIYGGLYVKTIFAQFAMVLKVDIIQEDDSTTRNLRLPAPSIGYRAFQCLLAKRWDIVVLGGGECMPAFISPVIFLF